MASCMALGRLLFLLTPDDAGGEPSGDRFVPFVLESATDLDAELDVDAFAAGLAKYEEISLEAILSVLRSIQAWLGVKSRTNGSDDMTSLSARIVCRRSRDGHGSEYSESSDALDFYLEYSVGK